MKELKEIQEKIQKSLDKHNKYDQYEYFEFLTDISEKIIIFDLKVDKESICYKVYNKASQTINLLEIYKSNPSLKLKCYCIYYVLKSLALTQDYYFKPNITTKEIDFTDFIISNKLKKYGFPIHYIQNSYSVNDKSLEKAYVESKCKDRSLKELASNLLKLKHRDENLDLDNLNLVDLFVLETAVYCYDEQNKAI